MKALEKGASFSREILITEESVLNFSHLSGDRNPIHLDAAYASRTKFKVRIVPGIQIASYISAVLANDLPGEGTVYLEQNLRFLAPAHLGESIKIVVTVVDILPARKFVLSTCAYDENGRIFIDGFAKVKVMEFR